MALSPNQQTQYNQLLAAGAPEAQAMSAALLVPGTPTPQATMASPSPAPTTTPTAPTTIPNPPTTTPTQPPQNAPQQPVTVNVNTPSAQAEPYTVKGGDTLSGIAKAQGSTLADILASNPQYQQNPNLIRPGEKVNVAKKYQDYFEEKKTTTAPDANPRLDIQEGTKQDKPDPQAQFQDALSNMNPVERMLYDQLSTINTSQANQQTFTEQFKQLEKEQGLSGLKTDLMNINNIINGTEDDIRDEIVKGGGTGTESQIAAMTAGRNKTLLKQSKVLSDALQAKEDYIDQIMRLTQADRAEATKQVETKLGLTKQLADIIEKQQSSAKNNYQKIVDTVGYQGLANSFAGNPTGMARAEQILGLGKGSLTNPAFLEQSIGSKSNVGSVQEYEYAKKQGYKGTFIDYQNEDANRKRSIAAAGVANESGMNSKQVSIFNSIVDKQNKSPLIAANDRAVILKNVTEAVAKDPTNASLQVSFIYSLIQALDTYQSAVREGEIGLISGTQGLGEKLTNLPSKIEKGNPLGESKIAEYVATSKLITDSIGQAAQIKRDQFSAQANIAGIGTPFSEYQTATGGMSSSNSINVFSPNGSPGTIPASQKEAALKAGYKLR